MNNILFKLENRIKEVSSYILIQLFSALAGIIIVFLPISIMLLLANITMHQIK